LKKEETVKVGHMFDRQSHNMNIKFGGESELNRVADPGRITIYSISWGRLCMADFANVGISRTKNPPDGNNYRIPYSVGFLLKQIFSRFKYEKVIKVKNKPDRALLQASYLSNDIKKHTKIS
jgi:hypothetical protein